MRVWQSKTPAYISHTFFLRRPRGFNTTGPFLMCDLFWNLLSKQPYILQLLHFNSLSRRREHQTSTAPPGLAAGIGRHRDLHRSPLRFLTSTPKPRAEGSSPSAPATKPAETLRFCRFSFYMCCMVMVFTLVQTVGFHIRLHLPAPASIPSSTQNAPGFAFFWLNRVRFLFLAVFRAQNFWTGFCASCRTAITG